MVTKLRKLTEKEKAKLKKHSKNQTRQHMARMRFHMMLGKSFRKAHELAKKK